MASDVPEEVRLQSTDTEIEGYSLVSSKLSNAQAAQTELMPVCLSVNQSFLGSISDSSF